jgi:hypothetical protein
MLHAEIPGMRRPGGTDNRASRRGAVKPWLVAVLVQVRRGKAAFVRVLREKPAEPSHLPRSPVLAAHSARARPALPARMVCSGLAVSADSPCHLLGREVARSPIELTFLRRLRNGRTRRRRVKRGEIAMGYQSNSSTLPSAASASEFTQVSSCRAGVPRGLAHRTGFA